MRASSLRTGTSPMIRGALAALADAAHHCPCTKPHSISASASVQARILALTAPPCRAPIDSFFCAVMAEEPDAIELKAVAMEPNDCPLVRCTALSPH